MTFGSASRFLTQTGDFGAPPCEPHDNHPFLVRHVHQGIVLVLPLWHPSWSPTSPGRPWNFPMIRPEESLYTTLLSFEKGLMKVRTLLNSFVAHRILANHSSLLGSSGYKAESSGGSRRFTNSGYKPPGRRQKASAARPRAPRQATRIGPLQGGTTEHRQSGLTASCGAIRGAHCRRGPESVPGESFATESRSTWCSPQYRTATSSRRPQRAIET